MAGDIRIGVGGWVYEPWRDNFYPYPAAELDAWTGRLRAMAKRRDISAYVVNGAKEKAPAAATAPIARLAGGRRKSRS